MSDESTSLLWQPDADRVATANVTAFIHWLRERGITDAKDYAELHDWSVNATPEFWRAIIDYFDIPVRDASDVTDGAAMPDTQWFPGARINYMDQVVKFRDAPTPAIIAEDDAGARTTLGWPDLLEQSARLAATLRAQGVSPGDRVVAYLPNIIETIVAFHATARVGAVWSVCSPDLGSKGVLDRFTQIEPSVLIACDGYHYGGKPFDRHDEVAAILEGLPTVHTCIQVNVLSESADAAYSTSTMSWDQALQAEPDEHIAPTRFSDPLWILYSSGTTGTPKAIVHGHGGVVLEHVKQVRLQLDLNAGDRFLWYSSTAWMMWNFNIAGLLTGTTVCIFDGNPGKPDLYRLWRMVDELGIHCFGAGAAFFDTCRQQDITPNQQLPLTELRALGSTGSPLSPEGFDWIYESVKSDLYLSSISGGTDFATACVGGSPTVPVHRGEIACRSLGCAVAAFDPDGQPLIDEVGELVITQPMPSMPLYFWGDDDKRRYRDSYFSMYPDIWQHGDWIRITESGSAVIYGRSDATINRQGIRMGTADIYNVVEAEPEVVDSLIVDLEYLGRDSWLPLFVVLADGDTLTDDLRGRINTVIRTQLSPRHVPDDIFVIDDVPRTFSGKKMEIPVRRVLLGQTAANAINRDTMSNPESIDFFVELAAKRAAE